MPDFLQREREEHQRRVAQFSTAPEDPCLCRKGGGTGEDCPWKCPPYRPAAEAAPEPFPIITRGGTAALGGGR